MILTWWNKTLTYFAGYLEIYDMSSCPRCYLASMTQSMTGVLSRRRLDFFYLPGPLGAHFPAQRLTIEPNKSLALPKTCQVGVCAMNTLPPPPSEKGPFLRGGGSVHRLFSVCALGRLSFQFRIPTKPRIRTLAKMSSFSLSLLHLLHLDKWQLAKCDVISSMHSVTNTFSSTPLLGPDSVYDLVEELLDEIAEKAIFHN